MIRVAGAPVSFGVFELAPEEGVTLADADTVCEVLASAGYTGVDMGPPGFLGRGPELRDRLARYGLELAGGWIDLPFSDGEEFAAALPGLESVLEVFSEAAEAGPELLPLPTLACSGSEARRANPGGGPELELTPAQWDVFAANVTTAAERIRARGLEPTFHHHACTYVETPAEIDEFLARTDVGLTFDTGHLILGGGEPLDGWRRWHERINHLHLKDARREVLADVLARKGGMREVWAGKAFVPFGAGDLEMRTIMDEIVAADFSGWLVVEQDVIPQIGDDPTQIRTDHLTNREALRAWV